KLLSVKGRIDCRIVVAHFPEVCILEKVWSIGEKTNLGFDLRILIHMFSVYQKFSSVRPDNTADHAKKRTLSGSVRADQPEYHTVLYGAGYVVCGVNVIECLVKVFQFDHIVSPSRYSRSRTALYSGRVIPSSLPRLISSSVSSSSSCFSL